MLAGYEPFSVVEDQINGIVAVPTTGNAVNVQVLPLANVNLLSDLDFIFDFLGTWNAFTAGNNKASSGFPYLFVGSLSVPYQSGALRVWDGIDGDMGAIINQWRSDNRRHDRRMMVDQVPLVKTAYSATASSEGATTATQNLNSMYSDTTFTFTGSQASEYTFRLRVPIAEYFEMYLDKVESVSQQGSAPQVQINPYSDVFVNFLAMNSTGRAITPVVQLNPVVGSLVNKSPIVTVGATAATWTDNGSTLTVRREGIYNPAAGQNPPPSFPWAPNWRQVSVPLSSTKFSYTLPPDGQLLATVMRSFDPTLTTVATTAGDFIKMSQINGAGLVFKVGSGIVHYADTFKSNIERLLRQHGQLPHYGVVGWDFKAEERSNGAYVVDTYEVSSPTITMDLGSNTPGSGSIVDLALEFLTGIA